MLRGALGALLLAVAPGACRGADRPGAVTEPATPRAVETVPREEESPGSVELTESFVQGMLDTAGPVVDLGDPQSLPSLRATTPLATEVVNGESWARVGTRLRLRVVIDPTRAPEEPPAAPPGFVRLRVRQATARSVAVIVDGLLVRTAALPGNGATAVLSLPVPPDRFRRSVADVELRFGAPRAAALGGAPVVSLDWVHLARAEVLPARVGDLVNDVAVTPVPRRALTLFAPTELSTLRIVPERTVWRMSLAAEAPRGAPRAPRAVVARFRVEADGVAPIDRRVRVTPNTPWRDTAVDLSAFAGRAARLSIAAEPPEGEGQEERAEVRLAVAAARLERSPAPPPVPPGPRARVRHVVLVVLRGARVDRFLPRLASRFEGGGFATLLREGVVAEAVAPSVRAWSATVSAATGLPADSHGIGDPTDLLDDEAPTPATILAEHGVATAFLTDDPVFLGSGIDRGYARREGCPEGQPTCRAGGLLAPIADGLRTAAGSSFTLVVTRAGTLPLDPANEAVLALDPVPYEGTLTPAQTGVLATRARRGELRLDARDRDRLGLLYDAALHGIDRGLLALLERLRDLRLEGQTLVMVVGDRGTALGAGRYVGDGPMAWREIASTVLLARGGGLPAGRVIPGVCAVGDALATALDALGVSVPAEIYGTSLFATDRLAQRALAFVATPRGELGLRFGPWIALPRPPPLAGLQLYAPADDPTAADDRSDAFPLTRTFAELVLARLRGDPARRLFERSTRTLAPPAP